MMNYEVVREIQNPCPNNQKRDVSFREVETDDPVAYVRSLLLGKEVDIAAEPRQDGSVTVFARCDGLIQKFEFTPI